MPLSTRPALAPAVLLGSRALAEPAPTLPRAKVLAPARWRTAASGLLEEPIAIDSTHARGSPAAAEWGAAKARAAGFAAQEAVVIAPPDHPSKANLLIRLKGRGKVPPLMVQGHLDVVADSTAHGRDERILAQDFDEGGEAAYRLIKALSAAGP